MIINIRGTSGSGKSTVVVRLMEATARKDLLKQVWYDGTRELLIAPGEPVPAKPAVLRGYHIQSNSNGESLRIVGKYETACGGCDGIKTQNEVQHRVQGWHNDGHNVLFEGLLISHIYGRWAQLAKDNPGEFHFAFLDTPLETCLARVAQRRAARGNDKPLNPTNTEQKWKDARRVYHKALHDGLECDWWDADKLYEMLEYWLISTRTLRELVGLMPTKPEHPEERNRFATRLPETRLELSDPGAGD